MTCKTRTIIRIDEEKCNGCGLCVQACHEGAIDLVGGKAKLMREHFCDGLGDCLPACPTGAITFEEREAAAYNEAAVIAAQMSAAQANTGNLPCGCPGSMAKTFDRTSKETRHHQPAGDPGMRDAAGSGNNRTSAAAGAGVPAAGAAGAGAAAVKAGIVGAGATMAAAAAAAAMQGAVSRGKETAATAETAQTAATAETVEESIESELRQWPVQIKLVSPNAPYLNGADLLIAADCAAFAYGSFHRDFMAGKITLIGCPKLDAVDYAEKLTQIVAENDVASITVARMEVPCCGGIEQAVIRAVAASGKGVPVDVVTISTDGRIV